MSTPNKLTRVVLWVCDNDHDFRQFQDSCMVIASGTPRYCCPENFAPTCG